MGGVMIESADATPLDLPEGCDAYRSLGPFTAETVPAGLRKAHSLKAGCWGVLKVEDGAVNFVWEDTAKGAAVRLQAGDSILIPPGRLHHLDLDSAVTLGITFYQRTVWSRRA